MDQPRLTGLFSADLIGAVSFPRLAPAVLEGFRRLGDLTGTASDALDLAGLRGAVSGMVLRCQLPGARIVAQALTVRNVLRPEVEVPGARLGDLECHNLARPGDVLVIEGSVEASSMGGISATLGKRQGEAGAVVDGAVRDVETARALGYPIWARGPSPLTGKHRLRTAEINGPVRIGGVGVHPGDLVLADETGVAFIPFGDAERVLAIAVSIAGREASRLERIRAGTPVWELGRDSGESK